MGCWDEFANNSFNLAKSVQIDKIIFFQFYDILDEWYSDNDHYKRKCHFGLCSTLQYFRIAIAHSETSNFRDRFLLISCSDFCF